MFIKARLLMRRFPEGWPYHSGFIRSLWRYTCIPLIGAALLVQPAAVQAGDDRRPENSGALLELVSEPLRLAARDISETDNGYPLWVRAAEQLDEEIAPVVERLTEAAEQRGGQGLGEQWRRDVRQLVEAHAEHLRLLEQGLDRPHVVIPPPDHLWLEEWPELDGLVLLAAIAQLDYELAVSEHRWNDASRRLVQVALLGNRLMHADGVMKHYHTGVEMRRRAMVQMLSLVEQEGVPRADMDRLLDTLRKMEGERQAAMRSARVSFWNAIRTYQRWHNLAGEGKLRESVNHLGEIDIPPFGGFLRLAGIMDDAVPAINKGLGRPALGPPRMLISDLGASVERITKMITDDQWDILSMLGTFRLHSNDAKALEEAIEQVGQVLRPRIAEAAGDRQAAAQLRWVLLDQYSKYMHSMFCMDLVAGAVLQSRIAEAERIGCLVVLASRVFERSQGRMPRSLQELVDAELLPSFPRDPFGADPKSTMQFDPKRGLVWSIGFEQNRRAVESVNAGMDLVWSISGEMSDPVDGE